MSRLKRARRIVLLVAVLLVMAVVGVGILAIGRGAAVASRRPRASSRSRASRARCRCIATPSGVPTIYADNASDLFRAQGFVSAQDRFFEMDLRRHVTAGRLSELVGSAGHRQ